MGREQGRAQEGTRRATWIGHSTTLLQLGARSVLLDPMWSERASPVQWLGPRRLMPPALPLADLPVLDVIAVSHNHYDHLDRGTVQRLARAHPEAHWVVPLRLGRPLRRWGARTITELDWWESAAVAGVRVTATPARHFSARRLGDRNRVLWCGFVVEGGGGSAYYAGDTALHPDFAAIGRAGGPFGLIVMPIGAYDPRWMMQSVHVDPPEAVQAYEELTGVHPAAPPPLMLAVHWGTFRLTDEPVEEPPERTRARWLERGLDAHRLWIPRFGETRRW